MNGLCSSLLLQHHKRSESIGRSSDSLYGMKRAFLFLLFEFRGKHNYANKEEFPMIEHANYGEKITITKGSTDSLHIRLP